MGEERSHIVFQPEAIKSAKLENSILRTKFYQRRTMEHRHNIEEHTVSNESIPIECNFQAGFLTYRVSDEYIPDVMR